MRRCLRSIAVLAPVLLLGLMAWFMARGSLAETPLNPSQADAPVVQVVDDELGRGVRAVIDLPGTLEEIWDVLTDPEHYGDYCPYLRHPTFVADPNRTVQLTGHVQGWANTFPLAVEIRQEQFLDEYRATWAGANEDVPVNRGRWTLRRHGDDQVRVEVLVVAEVRRVPTFLVRLLLRERVAHLLVRLRERLADRKTDW